MSHIQLSAMIAAIANGGAKSMVRVSSASDRDGIQQALDVGADGVLIPYINTAEEAAAAVSCAMYPTAGTRSVRPSSHLATQRIGYNWPSRR